MHTMLRRFIGFSVAIILAASNSSGLAQTPLPDFSITTLAEGGGINEPTAISVSPDGRIFVAS